MKHLFSISSSGTVISLSLPDTIYTPTREESQGYFKNEDILGNFFNNMFFLVLLAMIPIAPDFNMTQAFFFLIWKYPVIIYMKSITAI